MFFICSTRLVLWSHCMAQPSSSIINLSNSSSDFSTKKGNYIKQRKNIYSVHVKIKKNTATFGSNNSWIHYVRIQLAISHTVHTYTSYCTRKSKAIDGNSNYWHLIQAYKSWQWTCTYVVMCGYYGRGRGHLNANNKCTVLVEWLITRIRRMSYSWDIR